MIRAHPVLEDLSQTLQAVLDQEIELLTAKLAQIDLLSAGILSRDEAAVEAVLQQIEQAQQRQEEVDLALAAVRKELAAALGDASDLKLSAVVARLPSAAAREIAQRRQRIIELASRLRERHVEMGILLREAARINRMLLEGLLSGGASVTTYDAQGKDHWRARNGLVDTER